MALRDLALSKSGDLLINESGDFTIIDSVRQGIQIKLRWIKGEWVFNPEMGVPDFSEDAKPSAYRKNAARPDFECA